MLLLSSKTESFSRAVLMSLSRISVIMVSLLDVFLSYFNKLNLSFVVISEAIIEFIYKNKNFLFCGIKVAVMTSLIKIPKIDLMTS